MSSEIESDKKRKLEVEEVVEKPVTVGLTPSKKSKLTIGSKTNDHVETPPDLYAFLDLLFHFNFDPCPFRADFNGLKKEWGSSNFINPPYSNIQPWLKKGVQEMEKGNTSVFLVPARTNSKYWYKLAFKYASEIWCMKSKIKFKGYTKGSPVPIAVVVYRPAASAAPQASPPPTTDEIERHLPNYSLKHRGDQIEMVKSDTYSWTKFIL